MYFRISNILEIYKGVMMQNIIEVRKEIMIHVYENYDS